MNRHETVLAGLRSFDILNRTDVIWSSSKAEDMEAAMRLLVEVSSLMDWWTLAVKSLALQSSGDSCLVLRLSLAGGRCQLLVAKTTSTLWADIVLKWHDAMLVKVKDTISFESFLDLHNARLSFTKLFPADVLEIAVKRSCKVLHDEAIRKVVAQESLNRRAKSCTFRGCLASSGNILSGLLALLPVHLSGLPPLHHRPPRLLPLLLVVGRGRNFEGSSPPSRPQVGGVLGRH